MKALFCIVFSVSKDSNPLAFPNHICSAGTGTKASNQYVCPALFFFLASSLLALKSYCLGFFFPAFLLLWPNMSGSVSQLMLIVEVPDQANTDRRTQQGNQKDKNYYRYCILVFINLYLSLALQSTGLPQQNFMHVAPGGLSYSSGAGGPTSQALAAATAALADSGILSSPHTHLHRNINSPQRPTSTGNTGVSAYVFQEGKLIEHFLS